MLTPFDPDAFRLNEFDIKPLEKQSVCVSVPSRANISR